MTPASVTRPWLATLPPLGGAFAIVRAEIVGGDPSRVGIPMA